MRSLIVFIIVLLLGSPQYLVSGATAWVFWIFFVMDLFDWFFRSKRSISINMFNREIVDDHD